MTLNEIKDILQAEVLTCNSDMNMAVDRGCSSDLMSDVLAFSKPGALLITGLTNEAAIRTAEVANVKAIIFVRGKRPNSKAVTLAEEKKIPLLATNFPMFEACGRLYERGLRGSPNNVK
ncbi:MAG: DRTGG domain-containing protein [Nitrospirota bacterium]